MRMSDRPKNNIVCASVGMSECACLIDLKIIEYVPLSECLNAHV